MTNERLAPSAVFRALVFLAALLAASPSVLAQRLPLAMAWPLAPAYVSVSGSVALGFPRYGHAPSPDIFRMLPPGSEIPASCGVLLEEMWRGSPTFRRQWTRIAEAKVRVSIRFDAAWRDTKIDARSVVSRQGGLRVDITLSATSPAPIEHLAHELEHVLEQLDEVDLAGAVSARVHGATAVRASRFYETRRAHAIGRLVAAEVSAFHNRR
jgi:hypothetical protein